MQQPHLVHAHAHHKDATTAVQGLNGSMALLVMECLSSDDVYTLVVVSALLLSHLALDWLSWS